MIISLTTGRMNMLSIILIRRLTFLLVFHIMRTHPGDRNELNGQFWLKKALHTIDVMIMYYDLRIYI